MISNTDFYSSDSIFDDIRDHGRHRLDEKEKSRSPKPLRLIYDIIENAVDYRTYRWNENSDHYGSKVAPRISKWQRKIQVQLSGLVFDGTDKIEIINF